MTLNSPLQATRVGAVLVLLGGCAGSAGSGAVGPNGSLSASPRPYETDIPLPAGFTLVDRSSEDWSGGSVRYLRHRYVGRADRQSVRAFYRKQMPLVRWKGISDSQVHGRVAMRFERDDETCTIAIERAGGALGNRVVVEVMITPLKR